MKQLRFLFAMLLFFVGSAAFAETVEIDGIYYNLSDTAVVTEIPRNYSGELNIPATVEYNGQTYRVTAIKSYAFQNCSQLTAVTIPASVIDIDYPLFSNCENLETIVVAEENPVYDSREGCNAIIRKKGNVLVAGCKNTVIPYGVEEIFYKALAFRSLTRIDIPNSVRILQPGVFEGSGLTNIYIPASVTSLYDNPFRNCMSLTAIEVDEANSRYDSRNNCNAIIETRNNKLVTACRTTVINSSVTAFGSYVFAYRSELSSFEIPENITEIDTYAFGYCTGLDSIVIPDNVTFINNGAFYYCANMKTARIGKGIKKLGNWIFSSCYNLTDLYIEAENVPEYSGNPLEGLNSNVTIHVPASALTAYQNARYFSDFTIVADEGGAAKTIKSTFTTWELYTNNDTYTLGRMHTAEGNDWYAAIEHPQARVAETMLDDTKCLIVDAATNELKISINNMNMFPLTGKVKKIIVNAAGNFHYIDAYVGDRQNQSLNQQAYMSRQENTGGFSDCELTFEGDVEYEDGIVTLSFGGGSPVFLHSITIVQEEGGGQSGPDMSGTTGDLKWEVTENGITSVWVNGIGFTQKQAYRLSITGEGRMGDYDMERNAEGRYVTTAPWIAFPTITEVSISEGAENVGAYAFAGLENLYSVSLPSTLKQISYYAFMNCPIESIDLPEGLTSILGSAFYWCTGLSSVRIPSTVTNVGNNAFQGNNLTELVVAEGNSRYDSRGGCNAVIETATNTLIVGTPATVIPASVTAIGNLAFNNMYYLETMVIPEGVTSIGESAFSSCMKLKEVELPSTVTSIGQRAFNYCKALTKVTLGSGLISIARGAFGDCSNMEEVYCYANPGDLDWADYANSGNFKANKATKFHVFAAALDAWQTKYPNLNATFVGDLSSGEVQLVDPELAFSRDAVHVNYGRLPIAPTLKNKWRVETLWTSANERVATVDQDGRLTVKGIGETEISAIFAGDDVYQTDTASYVLTVLKGVAEVTFPVKLYTTVQGSTDNEWPVATVKPASLAVVYSSNNGNVASVDRTTGAVTLQGVGNALITATFAGNDYYNAAEATYTLSVAKADAKQPQLDFGYVKTVHATIDGTFTEPQINNPEALALSWSTDDAAVATVDENGRVNLTGAVGTTTVTATWAGSDEWKAASASYELEVRIVESVAEETSITFGGEDSTIDEETNLENTTVGNVLFTLDSTQGDGYDSTDQSISLQSTLTGDQIEAIISTTEPGSAEFAAAFTGMSFLLNAGKGSVDVDFFTMGDHQLSVKLGSEASVTFTQNERGTTTIDYDVDVDTWVYIYASMKPATVESRALLRATALRYLSWLNAPVRQHRAPADELSESRLKIYGFNIKPIEIATGISELNAEGATVTVGHRDGRAYNLNGQRVATLQRGINIVNGRKVVIK